MANTYTRYLNLRQNQVGTAFPAHLVNRWGEKINEELAVIDQAIGAVCTPEQIAAIKAAVSQVGPRGVLL